MFSDRHSLTVKIGDERFSARRRRDLAPRSCACLMALLPYSGSVIHARWSGEALWSPLVNVLAPELTLPGENSTSRSGPGEILLSAGERSEPELLIPYGMSRFAGKTGPLEGNPVLRIEDFLERISGLGHEVLWGGAMPFSIEDSP